MAIVRCVSRSVAFSVLTPCPCISPSSDAEHLIAIVLWQDIELKDENLPINHANMGRIIQQGLGLVYNCSRDPNLQSLIVVDSSMFDILSKIGPILSDCSARWDWASAQPIHYDEDIHHIENDAAN